MKFIKEALVGVMAVFSIFGCCSSTKALKREVECLATDKTFNFLVAGDADSSKNKTICAMRSGTRFKSVNGGLFVESRVNSNTSVSFIELATQDKFADINKIYVKDGSVGVVVCDELNIIGSQGQVNQDQVNNVVRWVNRFRNVGVDNIIVWVNTLSEGDGTLSDDGFISFFNSVSSATGIPSDNMDIIRGDADCYVSALKMLNKLYNTDEETPRYETKEVSTCVIA